MLLIILIRLQTVKDRKLIFMIAHNIVYSKQSPLKILTTMVSGSNRFSSIFAIDFNITGYGQIRGDQ